MFRAGVAAPALLEKSVCDEAELEVDVADHGERVGAGDEVLLDYDRSLPTRSFETAGAALEHHVAGRDSSAKVHPPILNDCRQTITVGGDVRDSAGGMRDVRVVGVGQELNRAVAAELSEMSPVTRYHDGRADDIAGVICDERRDAIAVGGKWTLSCANRDDSQQQGENENEGSDDDKTVHDDLLHIDSNVGLKAALPTAATPYNLKWSIIEEHHIGFN